MSRSPRSLPPFAQQQAVTTPSPPLVQLDRGVDRAQPPLGAHAVRASAAVRRGCGCESARRVGGQRSGHGRADAQEARATAQVRAHGSMALALPSSPPPSPAAPRPLATSSTSMTGSPSAPPSDPNAKRRDSSGKKKQFEALVRVLLPCSVSYITFTPHILTESPSRHDSDNQLHDAVEKHEQYLVFVPSPHLPQHARQDLLLKFSFLFLLGEQKFDPMDSGRI